KRDQQCFVLALALRGIRPQLAQLSPQERRDVWDAFRRPALERPHHYTHGKSETLATEARSDGVRALELTKAKVARSSAYHVDKSFGEPHGTTVPIGARLQSIECRVEHRGPAAPRLSFPLVEILVLDSARNT